MPLCTSKVSGHHSPPKMPVFGTATVNLSSARRPATAPSAVQQQAACENVPPAADAAAPSEDRSEAEGRMRDSLLRRWEAEVLPVSQARNHGPVSVTPTEHHASLHIVLRRNTFAQMDSRRAKCCAGPGTGRLQRQALLTAGRHARHRTPDPKCRAVAMRRTLNTCSCRPTHTRQVLIPTCISCIRGWTFVKRNVVNSENLVKCWRTIYKPGLWACCRRRGP
jgi:hypothetical protein